MKRFTKEILQDIKTNISKKIGLITIDELNDSNRIIKFVGIVFIITGVLAFTNIVILNDLVLASLSLSGIFFIVADFFEYIIKDIEKKIAIPTIDRCNKRKNTLLEKLSHTFLQF